MSKQGVTIHHVPSNSEGECSGTFAATARARGKWNDESSSYKQGDDGITDTGLTISPGKTKIRKNANYSEYFKTHDKMFIF